MVLHAREDKLHVRREGRCISSAVLPRLPLGLEADVALGPERRRRLVSNDCWQRTEALVLWLCMMRASGRIPTKDRPIGSLAPASTLSVPSGGLAAQHI